LINFLIYLTIGFRQYSWYVARKDCSRNLYKGVRIIHAEKEEKLLVTPCRHHCPCKKIENRLLLVQNIHGYLGHIYEENLGRECENPFAKRRKLDYEIEELKVQNQRLSDQVSELQKNVTKNNENVEAKDNLINALKIENEKWSDQVAKLQDSLKAKDEEIGSKNESLKIHLKTEAKERIQQPVLAKLYAENKKFSDDLRKYKEAMESRDKEIENLSGQIDKLQGILKAKIKEIADLNECLQKTKANEKDDLGELDKKNKVIFDLYTEMKKKYTEVKKSSEIGESKVKELKEAIDDLHVKESAKNEFMEEFKKDKNDEVNLHLKQIIKLKEKLQKVEDLKSSIEFPNRPMITMVKNDDNPEASSSKG
jgi:chromosome segregation ATPase